MNVEAGAHPKSRDQIVIRRGTSQSGAGGVSLADAFFVVERDGTELYIDRINEPSSSTTDHGALTGLGDDDHTQYALADGTRGSFVTAVSGTAPIAITGTSTAPNVTLGSLDASQTTTGIFTPARLGSGTASANTFLRGDSTFTQDVPLQVSVKNTSGGALTKGTPVYATGTVGSTAVIEIAAADASNSAKMPAIGLLEQDLAVNATGLVMVMGTITGMNTTGYTINSPVFVAAGGGLTNTRPTGATTLIQNVARATRVHGSTGEVLVLGPGRTNDVPNLIGTNFLASSGTASATTFLRGDQSWSTAVTGVTGTAPIVSSGGAAPAISVTTGFAASTVAAGDDARIVAFPLLVTGQYTSTSSITTASTTLTTNRLYYLPFLITVSTTFDRIAINHVLTVAGAGSVARLGIYNSTSGLPSTRVLDAGTVDLSTGAALKFVSISQTLTPGLYWLAAVPQIVSGSPTFTVAPPSISVPSETSVSAGTKYEGSVTGALPATATPLASNVTQPPVIYLRKS